MGATDDPMTIDYAPPPRGLRWRLVRRWGLRVAAVAVLAAGVWWAWANRQAIEVSYWAWRLGRVEMPADGVAWTPGKQHNPPELTELLRAAGIPPATDALAFDGTLDIDGLGPVRVLALLQKGPNTWSPAPGEGKVAVRVRLVKLPRRGWVWPEDVAERSAIFIYPEDDVSAIGLSSETIAGVIKLEITRESGPEHAELVPMVDDLGMFNVGIRVP